MKANGNPASRTNWSLAAASFPSPNDPKALPFLEDLLVVNPYLPIKQRKGHISEFFEGGGGPSGNPRKELQSILWMVGLYSGWTWASIQRF